MGQIEIFIFTLAFNVFYFWKIPYFNKDSINWKSEYEQKLIVLNEYAKDVLMLEILVQIYNLLTACP